MVELGHRKKKNPIS